MGTNVVRHSDHLLRSGCKLAGQQARIDPPGGESLAILQPYPQASAICARDASDRADADDGGAVDADERLGVEPGEQALNRFAH